jgi:hypothetical protein
MRSRVPVLVLLVFTIAIVPLHAADRSVRGGVLVLLKSTTAEEDQEFRSLMLDVIRVEVEDRELEMIEPDPPPPAGEEPLSSAAKAGAEFALVAAYTLSARDTVFDLAWYDAAAKAKAASVSRTSALDFTLDVTIASAVVELLEGQKERIAAVLSARAASARLAAEKAAAEKAAEDKAAAEKAAAERAAIEAAANARAKAEADRQIAAAMKRPVRHWSLYAAGAPFLATVESSQYFTLGLSGALNGQYRFAVSGGLIGIGFATGFQRFRATGTGGEADSTLVPLGVTFAYGTNTGSRFDFLAHVDGGASLFILQPLNGIAEVGVVPFALGGVGITIAVFEKAGFIIDASYAAFFSRGVPIMGFSPSLGMFLRF